MRNSFKNMELLKPNIFHYYPFKLEFLKKNQNFIDWDWITWNEHLEWSLEEFEFLREKVKSKYPLKLILRNCKISSNQEIILKYFDHLNPKDLKEYGEIGGSITWDENLLSILKGKIELNSISSILKVSTDFLEKEKGNINWKSLSSNEQIQWTDKFIEKNKKLFDWPSLSFRSNLPWSDELIDKFKDSWDWNVLSQNHAINWTKTLIEKHENRLNCNRLSYNSNVNFTIEFVEKNIDKIDFGGLSRNKKINWSKEFIDKYEDRFIFGNYGLSWNFVLPWNEELIERYKNKWSWSGISANRGITWNLGLLDSFYDNLIWGKDNLDGDSADEGHRRNGFCLSNNPSLPWSINLIKKYENRWDSLASNRGVWEKVLEPIMTEMRIQEIIK